MTIQRQRTDFEILPPETIAQWQSIPPAIVSDCMNREQVMAGAIKPVQEGTRLAGQARTVACMVGDNSALHVALGLVEKGQVLVVDAGGYGDTALWGGIMTRTAIERGIGGLVIDGAVRDVAEIREFGFKVFARAIVPAGPHKGFGGTIDGAISCGGCPVRPGDLIIGDDDGVCVVPLERQAKLLEASAAKIASEVATIADIAAGKLPSASMGLPDPEWID